MKYLSLLLALLLVLPLSTARAEFPDYTTETIEPGMPIVTKDPTDERVLEDGYCEFVARASYAKEIIWYLVSPDGTQKIKARYAPDHFPGLWVTGYDTERLGLDHIPATLANWFARAEFVGNTGNVYSHDAHIFLEVRELHTPTIELQPQNPSGGPATLEIRAVNAEPDGELVYQWYRNSTDRNKGGTPIPGATSPTYTPEAIPGTRYYSCTVRCTNGDRTSLSVRSQSVAVTFPEETEPAAAEAPVQSQPTAAPEPAITEPATLPPVPTTEPAAPQTPELLLPITPDIILTCVGGAIALIVLIGTVSLIRAVCSDRKRQK